MTVRWYAIHTYAGMEDKVQKAIVSRVDDDPETAGKITEVLVPTEDVAEIRDGKRAIVTRKMYPGYIFVAMELTSDTQSLIRNTPGVTGFVGNQRMPVALADQEVETIRSAMQASEEAPKPKISFGTGDRVKVIEGPFQNFSGMVESINEDRGRLTVMVDILGRATPVELDFLQVEKIA